MPEPWQCRHVERRTNAGSGSPIAHPTRFVGRGAVLFVNVSEVARCPCARQRRDHFATKRRPGPFILVCAEWHWDER